MRVCSPHCGAEPESQSGGGVYERELLRSLAASGHDLHVILAGTKALPDGISGTVHRPVLRRGLRWWVTPFVWPHAIARCWRECGPFDLLRAHSVRYAGPSCLIARRRLGLKVPVVTHIHHLDPSPLNGLIERRVLNASDLVITDSDFARGQLVGLGVEPSKIRVVNSGIADHYRPDSSWVDMIRAARHGRFLVLACGQLIERKDPLFAIETMRAVCVLGLGGNVDLIWIGQGPMRATVERRIRDLGVEHMVKLVGHVSEDDKLALLRSCDVFIHPSVREGFALAPQEAMACGKPVIARSEASMGEMIENNVSGLIVGNPIEAAHGVAWMIQNPKMLRLMGMAASRRAEERFRWSRTSEGVETVYREAVGR